MVAVLKKPVVRAKKPGFEAVAPDPSPGASIAAKKAWLAMTLKSINEDVERLSANADRMLRRMS